MFVSFKSTSDPGFINIIIQDANAHNIHWFGQFILNELKLLLFRVESKHAVVFSYVRCARESTLKNKCIDTTSLAREHQHADFNEVLERESEIETDERER